MIVECIKSNRPWFKEGKLYTIEEVHGGSYHIFDDECSSWWAFPVDRYAGIFDVRTDRRDILAVFMEVHYD